MSHQNYLRIMLLLVCFGFVMAALHSSAEEKSRPDSQSATAEARRDAAKIVYEGSWQHYIQEPEAAPGGFDYYHEWSIRWMQAERDLSRTKAEEITAVEGHLKRMQLKKEMFDKMVREHMAPPYAASAAEFFCLEAEDWLTAARAGGK